jgi:hypothetical protein
MIRTLRSKPRENAVAGPAPATGEVPLRGKARKRLRRVVMSPQLE